jgi:hypothetical protein
MKKIATLFVCLFSIGCGGDDFVSDSTAGSSGSVNTGGASGNAGSATGGGGQGGQDVTGGQSGGGAAGQAGTGTGGQGTGGTCIPQNCPNDNETCGWVSDGCNGSVQCQHTCSGLETCGGGTTPNKCGCTPKTKEEVCISHFEYGNDSACGERDDGCGGTIYCGGCELPLRCNIAPMGPNDPPQVCIGCVEATVLNDPCYTAGKYTFHCFGHPSYFHGSPATRPGCGDPTITDDYEIVCCDSLPNG